MIWHRENTKKLTSLNILWPLFNAFWALPGGQNYRYATGIIGNDQTMSLSLDRPQGISKKKKKDI